MEVYQITEVLGMLENTIFYYEIITDQDIDTELSVDSLHRHVLDDFGIIDTNGYDIYQENNTWCLSMTLRLNDNIDIEQYLDLPATSENMKLCFAEYPKAISDEGKLIIPQNFEDYVYPDEEKTGFFNSIDVMFKFIKVGDLDLLPYITFF